MRSLRWILPGVALALLAGCGDRNLVLKVDVLSYLDPSLTNFVFGPVPAFPGGIESGELEVVKDVVINLVDGMGSVTEVQGVSIGLTAVAIDSTGAGTDTLRLYMSDAESDPLLTPPVMELPVVLTPGQTDTVTADVQGDPRVTSLFAGKSLRVTLTTSLRGPDSGDALTGRVEVRRLEAVLIASKRPNI